MPIILCMWDVKTIPPLEQRAQGGTTCAYYGEIIMAEYIKREDLKKLFEPKQAYFTEHIMRKIDRIPAADVVERKRGKWITDIDDCHYCSECGNPAEINYITGECMDSPYCSQCGADLR